MTRYFIVKYQDIQDNSSMLGNSAYFPVDSGHLGDFLPDDLMFLAQDGAHQDYFLGHKAFINLPDPLRAGAIPVDTLSKLPVSFALTSQSTMFDLLDKLTANSKDFQLKI